MKFRTKVERLVQERIRVVEYNNLIWISFNWNGSDIEISPKIDGGSYSSRRSMYVHMITDLVMDALELHDCEECIVARVENS